MAKPEQAKCVTQALGGDLLPNEAINLTLPNLIQAK